MYCLLRKTRIQQEESERKGGEIQEIRVEQRIYDKGNEKKKRLKEKKKEKRRKEGSLVPERPERPRFRSRKSQFRGISPFLIIKREEKGQGRSEER